MVKQALDLDHSVTAYARNPTNIQDIQHSSIKVVRDDVLDLTTVESAVQGHEAVFITIVPTLSRSGDAEPYDTKHMVCMGIVDRTVPSPSSDSPSKQMPVQVIVR